MGKNYLDFEAVSLPEVIADFKVKFPTYSYDTFDGLKMRKILAGELVMVKISGKNKFELWKQSDIDAGKLDERNRQIRRYNAAVRNATRGW